MFCDFFSIQNLYKYQQVLLFCKTFTINLLSPRVFYLVIWWYQAQCYFQEEAQVFLLGIEPGSLVNYQTKVHQTFYLADILWSGYYHQDLQKKPKKKEREFNSLCQYNAQYLYQLAYPHLNLFPRTLGGNGLYIH